jgi:hypothetical protein
VRLGNIGLRPTGVGNIDGKDGLGLGKTGAASTAPIRSDPTQSKRRGILHILDISLDLRRQRKCDLAGH